MTRGGEHRVGTRAVRFDPSERARPHELGDHGGREDVRFAMPQLAQLVRERSGQVLCPGGVRGAAAMAQPWQVAGERGDRAPGRALVSVLRGQVPVDVLPDSVARAPGARVTVPARTCTGEGYFDAGV